MVKGAGRTGRNSASGQGAAQDLSRDPVEIAGGGAVENRHPVAGFYALQTQSAGGGASRPELVAPQHVPSPQVWPESLGLDDLALLPHSPDWSGGLNRAWQVGEAAAHAALDRFIDTTIDRYDTSRDLPGETGTSRLSPHLHFGEISPVSIYHRVRARGGLTAGAEVFLSEVIWREFSYELLDQSPHMPDAPLRSEFNAFPGVMTMQMICVHGSRGARAIRLSMPACGSCMKPAGCIIVCG